MISKSVMLADINFLTYFSDLNTQFTEKWNTEELRNKVLYTQSIKEMLDNNNNVKFSKTESMSKSQGRDFVLEDKIKKQKGVAPKGIVNSKTWQKISGLIDKLEYVIDNAKKNIGISNVNSERNILLENEIMEWRAVLRLSSFLANSKCGFIQDVYGETLSDDLINLSRNFTNKGKNTLLQL